MNGCRLYCQAASAAAARGGTGVVCDDADNVLTMLSWPGDGDVLVYELLTGLIQWDGQDASSSLSADNDEGMFGSEVAVTTGHVDVVSFSFVRPRAE